MLDIRAVSYISPLAEMPFTDVGLTVRLTNLADETGHITGLFRVYNDTTSELIHSSEIAPLTLAAGEHADVSALTDFTPPAPLDDTYFVCFSGQATNPLFPHSVPFFLGAFHFDVKPGPLGPPPAAHAPTHEQAGTDPIETEDLGTAELDPTLRLAPDGAGGVSWAASVPPDWRHFHKSHFLHLDTVITTQDDTWSKIGGYSTTNLAGEPHHPGILRCTSPAGNNLLAYSIYNVTPFLLHGYETCHLVTRPKRGPGTLARFGWHDVYPSTAPNRGVYITIQNVGGTDLVAQGVCKNAGGTSTTATSYTLAVDSWYTLRITINPTATSVLFEVLSDAGVVLWSDTLATNIPVAAGQEVTHLVEVWNNDFAAFDRIDLDFLSVGFLSPLINSL